MVLFFLVCHSFHYRVCMIIYLSTKKKIQKRMIIFNNKTKHSIIIIIIMVQWNFFCCCCFCFAFKHIKKNVDRNENRINFHQSRLFWIDSRGFFFICMKTKKINTWNLIKSRKKTKNWRTLVLCSNL